MHSPSGWVDPHLPELGRADGMTNGIKELAAKIIRGSIRRTFEVCRQHLVKTSGGSENATAD